ncbi:zinc finger MYM-type 1-like [Pelobates cultripes]|uniref:Zinc finger MYM-type 1-like n=1 Tax=Pelobates cultripes TaxID=61616 RepID=A0AAD1RCL9_PELCU|nr:zinc finger MYM-type 1-like [Pelobates cultripes]
MDGENSCDAGLTLIQETSREQLEAIDQLQAEIKKRTTQMNTLHQRFAFLQIQTLLDTKKDDFIKKQIQHTCAQYTELNAASMLTEITRLRHHIILYKEVNPDEQVANWSALDLLRWVYKWKLQESLTNFVVTLRIFLTITVSTASCERSFSKLKLIKTYQRSTMSQERLSNLAILSIERDFNVDFNSVVEKFALIKSRRI